ncbi:MAG: phosphatase PAP2 family protein [Paracoccaceae bacterium]|nr:phosphatase PAP2 family protein [Paracoccaceae bacterium]
MTKILVPAATLCAFLATVAAPPAARADSKATWDKVSTGLALGLIGSASIAAFDKPDTQGQTQFLKTMGATLVITEALKALVHERRPDGSGRDSFPSGHAALAFAAASYFDIRYGSHNRALVPVFYGAAVLTAVGRVAADKHYFQDVAAGALLGYGMARFLTTSAPVAVYPTASGVGISYTSHF